MKKLRLNVSLVMILCVCNVCLLLVACSDQNNPIVSTINTVNASANQQNTATPAPTQAPTLAAVATATLLAATTTTTFTTTSNSIINSTATLGPTAFPTTPAKTAPSGSNLTGSPAAAHATMVASGSLSEVLHGPKGKKEIAITLDAGAGAVAFPKEIAALDKHNIKITFFLTGQWVRQNPQYAQQIAKDGMEIANHTYDHPYLTKLSDDKVLSEINEGAKAIEAVTGINTQPLFRFPYGDYDARTMKLLNSLGYRSIYWTYDSLDSVGVHKTADQLFKIVTSISNDKLDGAIILMHLGNDTSGDALGPILDNLQGRGFKIVTISELIGKQS